MSCYAVKCYCFAETQLKLHQSFLQLDNSDIQLTNISSQCLYNNYPIGLIINYLSHYFVVVLDLICRHHHFQALGKHYEFFECIDISNFFKILNENFCVFWVRIINKNSCFLSHSTLGGVHYTRVLAIHNTLHKYSSWALLTLTLNDLHFMMSVA